ncbi:hypothetical protein SteCoe_25196 [Stentor coeruleus]|uniref:Uncharacterized protein n=1 Tax=Stentor coeruleus TaxID=5963 RepID=A0A1R2BFT8_9CILI|nr:hypothetical protein SteCoe_25196 [Stentor coeruleus]
MLKFICQRFFTNSQVVSQAAVDLFNNLSSKVFLLEEKALPISALDEEYFFGIFQDLANQEKSYLIRGLTTLSRLKNSSVILRKYEKDIINSITSIDKKYIVLFLQCYSTIPDQSPSFLLEITEKIKEILPMFNTIELHRIYCAYIKNPIINKEFINLLKRKIIENIDEVTHDDMIEIINKFNLHKDEKIIRHSLLVIENKKDIFTYREKLHALLEIYTFKNIYSHALIADLYENIHSIDSLTFSRLCLYANKNIKAKVLFKKKLEEIIVNMNFDDICIETTANIIESFKSKENGNFICNKLLPKVISLINDFTSYQCSMISFSYGINNCQNKNLWEKIKLRALNDKGKIKKYESILMIYGIFSVKKLDINIYKEFSPEWINGELSTDEIYRFILIAAGMEDKTMLIELKNRMKFKYALMKPIHLKRCENILEKFGIA